MCGIMGFAGKGEAVKRVFSGLRALEYRGYDSAGLAWFDRSGDIATCRVSGRLSGLVEKMTGEAPDAACAIGHTRWATHGAPTERNCHPHGTSRLMLVHNGIIENYAAIKEELTALGYEFSSDTDSEVASCLIDFYLKHESDPISAIRCATRRMTGSYAFGIILADKPGVIYATRKESPLLVGLSEEGNFIASDITALLPHTRDYIRPDAGEIVRLSADEVRVYSINGSTVEKQLCRADWDSEAADLGDYPHYMLKEINEEPTVISRALGGHIKDRLPHFSEVDADRIRSVKRVRIVACGSALHAGMYGRTLFESVGRIPCDTEIASEFRYRDPILSPDELVILISQSGETADTLAALNMAVAAGCYTLGLVNVVGSSIARGCHSVIYTEAGPEIAVASTKAYMVQAALLGLFAIHMALIQKRIDGNRAAESVYRLQSRLPQVITEIIDRADGIRSVAHRLASAEDLYFIGRGTDYCAATEASLKLKEISYIHSEAYAAGELKHGSISLIEPDTPVVALSTLPHLREKMISNIKEVAARGARVISVYSGESAELEALSHISVNLPECHGEIAPLAEATALQLLAYYTAVERGCDVDKPRNLAKSVTVE